jgi:hypothetical protein
MAAERISPERAHQALAGGALLVCAYDDDEKCRQNLLEGALTLSELREREPSFPKSQPIIFYCA